MIAKRLTVIAETLLIEEQNGLRKGRSCMDCFFSASQIIENIENLIFPHMCHLLILKMPLTLWTETNYGLLCQLKEFQLT